MLTKQDLKVKYGDDIVFLFKGDEPFTEGPNNAPAGMLIERDGKIVCNECGKWFESLGEHLRTHKISARNYKLKYGFNLTAGLCSKKISGMRRVNALNRHKDKSLFLLSKCQGFGINNEKYKQAIKKRKTNNTIQRRNLFKTCPAQIIERMKLVVAKFGPNVSIRQAQTVDFSLPLRIHNYYGSWNNFKIKIGININNIGNKIIKKKADLIYDLRQYVNKYNHLPWRYKIDNFPHGKSSYISTFGSYRKAILACGIKYNRNIHKCELIN